MSSHRLNSRNNGLTSFAIKGYLMALKLVDSCHLVAVDGKDGNGSKPENKNSSFGAMSHRCLLKSPKNIMV